MSVVEKLSSAAFSSLFCLQIWQHPKQTNINNHYFYWTLIHRATHVTADW